MLLRSKVKFILIIGTISITLCWIFINEVKYPINNNRRQIETLARSNPNEYTKTEHRQVKISGKAKLHREVKPKEVKTRFDELFNGADSIGLVKNKEDIAVKEKGYNQHSFNVLISDRIGLTRDLPDVRHPKCVGQKYGKISLTASIIICFHNEAWSTLLRTVHSVINRSPKHLLREVLLVDDHSELHHLTHALPNYLHSNFPSSVKLLPTDERSGLIRARLRGAKHASGDVLVFLDSHCEVNVGWLEPLLARIQDDRTTVVCPVVDTISSHTFVYESSPLVRGGFNWGMSFGWESIPPGTMVDPSIPYKSPTMSGGLFAMDRNYFFHLGSYDTNMNIWGAENLEISFRIWMCGGRLEIVPCSHVGHVFRNRRPYTNGGKGDTMSKNTIRLVEVWLDEYKVHFYNLRPELKGVNVDVTMRRALRRKLSCKTFKWYLDVVYPELGIPMVRDGLPLQRGNFMVSDVRFIGKLENVGLGLCFDTRGEPNKKMSNIVLRKCHKTMTDKLKYNSADELKVSKRLCVDIMLYSHSKNEARTMKCHGAKAGQEWKHKSTQQLYNPALGMCLASSDKRMVVTQICDSSSLTQKWKFRV